MEGPVIGGIQLQ